MTDCPKQVEGMAHGFRGTCKRSKCSRSHGMVFVYRQQQQQPCCCSVNCKSWPHLDGSHSGQQASAAHNAGDHGLTLGVTGNLAASEAKEEWKRSRHSG